MGKTSLDPTLVGQLKKLFMENLEGRNALVKYGRVRLKGGQRVVALPAGFDVINIQATGIGTSTPTKYYIVDTTQKYKFTIISSSASDESEVFWHAIGN